MNSAAEIWKRVLTLMEEDLATTTLNTWFDDAQAVSIDQDRLTLYVPAEWKREIITSRYIPNIQKALKALFSADMEVSVVGELPREEEPSSFLPGTEAYTFDTFVVGSSNKFAYSAAKAVADAPGRAKGYNPLFLYGESGLGKTHLLYAIAHAVHAKHPDYNIVYIRGDAFTNELVNALARKQNQEFREKYRTADLFLMDDVQFIAGKDFSQEEMFHTFNTLYEESKQIVFTADRPPKEMLRLDDRLKTRFEWGLPVDIQRPDYETRVAIIKNKALARGMVFPDPVLRYVADNITANVRQIEGTVNKILAFQDLMGEQINVDTVTRAVQDLLKDKTEFFPSPQAIIEEVAKCFNVSPAEIMGSARNKDIVLARQVAMYVTRRMTPLSLQEIGAAFKRDHTTVMHSLERIETMAKKSPEMAEMLKDINANINARYE